VKNARVEPNPTEVMDVPADSSDATAGLGDALVVITGPRGGATAVRVVCHVAAELPLVVFAVIEMARGWRPLYDNAGLALRSYQVFSLHSPLVGHQMAVTVDHHAVFAPGPLQNWLLAVPVRLDPSQGVLWGAVLCAVIAVAVSIEATWVAGRWKAATVTSACIMVLFIVRTDVALMVLWDVWFAVLFLVATVCTGLAVATGRLRWWPVTVVVASVAAQCQAVFAPPVIAVCLVAPVVGIAVRRGRGHRMGRAWLAVGLGVGGLVWLAPLVQQATTQPGNLALLLRGTSQSGGTIGLSRALGALGGAVRPIPEWVHPPPAGGGFHLVVAVANIFTGPKWWGAAVLLLLVVIGVLAWQSTRVLLSALAWVSAAVAVGGVAAIAAMPLPQFLVFGYLGVLLVPIGMAAWVTLVWAGVEVLMVGVRRVGSSRRVAGEAHEIDVVPWGGRAGVVMAGVGVVLVALSAWAMTSGLRHIGGSVPTISGWPAVRTADVATAAVAQVAPRGPFKLQVVSPDGAYGYSVEAGVIYLLVTQGFDPRPDVPVAYPTFGRPPSMGPTVVLELPRRGGQVTAHLAAHLAAGGSAPG